LSTQWVWRTTTRTAAGTGQRDVVVVLVAGGDGGSVLVALVEDLPEPEPQLVDPVAGLQRLDLDVGEHSIDDEAGVLAPAGRGDVVAARTAAAEMLRVAAWCSRVPRSRVSLV
jgi:hypothetical protein